MAVSMVIGYFLPALGPPVVTEDVVKQGKGLLILFVVVVFLPLLEFLFRIIAVQNLLILVAAAQAQSNG
jgi:hypothetical protein